MVTNALEVPRFPRPRGWLAMLSGHASGGPWGERDQRGRAASRRGQTECAAIVFADVCGSTPLYKSAGDHDALRVVAGCMDSLARVAEKAGGTIIRSKGDDVLCTFADVDTALRAARAMVATQSDTSARVRVAIHHGSLIHAREDIFGDAVNVAAHVLGLAKPDEILTTGAAYSHLPRTERTTLRMLGEHVLKGSTEAVPIYAALPLERAGSTTQRFVDTTTAMIVASGGEQSASTRARLLLGDRQHLCREGESLTIGRSPECDLVVPESWASRAHATITVRQGKLTLKDHSSTGTRVALADGNDFFVRRETVVLTGAGVITPGGRHAGTDPLTLRFELERVD